MQALVPPAAARGGAVGRPLVRRDALAKVTGTARYAGDERADFLHGVLVTSTIASGRITGIEAAHALAVPGVIAVLSHADFDPARFGKPQPWDLWQTLPRPVLHTDRVNFFGQVVAAVIAESFEAAREAAALVEITYDAGQARLAFAGAAVERTRFVADFVPSDRRTGAFGPHFAAAKHRVDWTYHTASSHAMPMEPHTCLARWNAADESLVIHDGSQAPGWMAGSLARTLRLRKRQVRWINPFVGGGFGARTSLGPHCVVAALASRRLGRPVRVAMTRSQMFALTNHRSETLQRVRIAAEADGRFIAIGHDAVAHGAAGKGWIEQSALITRGMYDAPHRLTRHRVVRRSVPWPSVVRGPGETPGAFALESAIDELARELGLDPIALREKNEPLRHPESGKPWTSRSLLACYREGAARFGWRRAAFAEDGLLIGFGMAAGSYHALQLWSRARASLLADGKVEIALAASDIGTGTYTILAQIAADAMDMAAKDIVVRIGDSALPTATPSGGSTGAATFGAATLKAARALRRKTDRLMRQRGTASLAELAQRLPRLPAARAMVLPPFSVGRRYERQSHCAQFAEVAVDPLTGEVRVRRLVGAFAAGRILNPRTARSQLSGGMIWGIGQALTEASLIDMRDGRFGNADFAGYHVPVSADAPMIEAVLVEEEDALINPLGVKGVGELGMVGVAAAIANAVHDATGVRVRELPITPERFLHARDGHAAPHLDSNAW